MQIVIPYKESFQDELRYALRSIEKYLTGYDKIIIAGCTMPGWIKNVEHLKVMDGARKQANIMRKVREGKGNFIMWHDDHFLLKPLNTADFKRWHNGLLSQELGKRYGGGYKIPLENTLKLFDEPLNFDIHVPVVFNSEQFNILNTESFWQKEEYLVKSLYCNTYFDDSLNEYMEDCKPDKRESRETILGKIKDRLFFSVSGEMSPQMVSILRWLYPNKCKFEN